MTTKSTPPFSEDQVKAQGEFINFLKESTRQAEKAYTEMMRTNGDYERQQRLDAANKMTQAKYAALKLLSPDNTFLHISDSWGGRNRSFAAMQVHPSHYYEKINAGVGESLMQSKYIARKEIFTDFIATKKYRIEITQAGRDAVAEWEKQELEKAKKQYEKFLKNVKPVGSK